MADALNICLVSPYALAGGHPVAEYVRNEATGLAGRGHRVTVLAPSASSQSLRSGRRRLRSLAAGDARGAACAARRAAGRGRRPGRAQRSARPRARRRAADRGLGQRRAGRGRGRFRHRARPRADRAGAGHRRAAPHPRSDRGHLPRRDRARAQLSDPQRPAQALRVAHRCAARGQHARGGARRARCTRATTRSCPTRSPASSPLPARPAPGSWPSGRARAAASLAA